MITRTFRKSWWAYSVCLPIIALATQTSAQMTGTSRLPGDIATIGLVLLAVFLIYFIPTFVAFRRGHPNRWTILVINLVFGGTGIGWFGSLIWALNAVHLSPAGSNGGESGLNIFANDPVQVVLADRAKEANAVLDAAEQLHQLKGLLDAKVITENEYATLRKPLLDQLMA